MTTFGEIRRKALKQWLKETGRRVDEENPLLNDYNDSKFECAWQAEVEEGKHVSFFCSLGDSSSSLTDCLTDKRYDAIEWNDITHSEALFRYYRALLLVVEGVLTDLRDLLDLVIYDQIDPENIKAQETKATKKLKDSVSSYASVLDYINSVCKHRVKQKHKNAKLPKLHTCNHHLDIFFDDSGEERDRQNFIRLFNADEFKLIEVNGIEVPKLSQILAVVINVYEEVDKEFKSNLDLFNKFIEENSHDYPSKIYVVNKKNGESNK